VTAAVTAGRSVSGNGLRPFDPGRDLSVLADLIEVGFARSLDPSGRRMVRGLRALGRLGWLGGILGRWLLPPAANPQGFVWEEYGQVLGNASLLPVTGYPHRWVMANVAVFPEQRRKGIGRSLVLASVEHARKHGAREIILQVDQDNEAAKQLYFSLGFRTTGPRTTWVGRMSELDLSPSLMSTVRRRKSSEWSQQWELARRLHPEGLVWPYPTRPGYFRPSVWQERFRIYPDRHWVWFEGDRLLGSASLRWGLEPNQLRMILLVDEEHRGQIERELLITSLKSLQSYGEMIHLDYPTGEAEQVFRRIGLSDHRRLLWMSLKL
jgi:ribosomal protein S18 acetylase RimI-like enzyme